MAQILHDYLQIIANGKAAADGSGNRIKPMYRTG